MPLTLRIIISLIPISPVPVKTIATVTYQEASITAAVIPMRTGSAQLACVLMIWLNIARKNIAIFGLRRDIRKPSPKPLNIVWEWLDCGLICWTGRRLLVVIVRNPIYARRHAPENCRTNEILVFPTITSATPTAVRKAQHPMPIAWPRLVATP